MHYMNGSSYDLNDFIFDYEQGIYVFKTGTELINGPGVLMTSSCTLQYFFNSVDAVANNIFAQQILYYNNNIFKRICYWEETSPGTYRTEWGDWETYRQSDWRYIGEFVASETKSYPSDAKELIAEVPWVNTDFTYSYSFHIIAASNASMNNEEYYRLGSYDKMVNGTPQAGGASVKIDRRNKTIKVNSVYYNSASQSLSNMRFRIYYR